MDLSEQFAKEKDSYEDLIYLGINQNQWITSFGLKYLYSNLI
jgi:hypothetical protein